MVSVMRAMRHNYPVMIYRAAYYHPVMINRPGYDNRAMVWPVHHNGAMRYRP
jgi:hypothetical protein